MHLHARRLIIEAPGGGKLDVTADLPEHFAQSMEQLGFDPALSEAGPVATPPPERTKGEKKQAAKAHAKQYRKARRGERKRRAEPGGKKRGKQGAKPGTRGSR